jgi:hypothetical protein
LAVGILWAGLAVVYPGGRAGAAGIVAEGALLVHAVVEVTVLIYYYLVYFFERINFFIFIL